MTPTPLLSRANRALLSYLIDICGVLASLCLLCGWISDLHGGEAYHLSPTFFSNGFCLSPLFDCTHHTCSAFDAFGGTLFVAVAVYLLLNKRGGDLPTAQLMPVAAYLFSHAYGHYVAGTELNQPGRMDDGEKDMAWNELFILAAILSIGPFSGVHYLTKAGKMKTGLVANAIASTVLVIYIAIYIIYVRKPRYALLYINVTILLSSVLPRVLAVGYQSKEDVAMRADAPYFFANTAADLLVGAVVSCWLVAVGVERIPVDAMGALVGLPLGLLHVPAAATGDATLGLEAACPAMLVG